MSKKITTKAEDLKQRLSNLTKVKLILKIQEIIKYYEFYQTYRDIFNVNIDFARGYHPEETFRDIIHDLICVLYSSMFKELGKTKMNVNIFLNSNSTKEEQQQMLNVHGAAIYFRDKDLAHNDIHSETRTLNMKSFLSDDELDALIEFLKNNVLPILKKSVVSIETCFKKN